MSPLPPVLARVLCAVTALLAAALVVLATLLELDASYRPETSLLAAVPDMLIVLSFSLVGAVVAVKRPYNLVGWALSLAGFGMLVGAVLGAWGELAVLAKPEAGLPAGPVAGALAPGSWTPLTAGIFLLFLAFPGGRVPPRWRRVAPLVLVGYALVWAVISTAPELEPPLDGPNPLAPTDDERWLVAVYPVIAVCQACLVLAGISLIRRFRRSRGVERQQFKWLAASAGFLVALLPVTTAFQFSALAGALFTVALIALPVSVGIAVLRYRLYEIDRIVSRTLVYGTLTVVLGAAYAGLVLAGQALFSSFAGGSDLAIAGSTLVVAALFLPLRGRVQQFVDRRFYRRRYDAQRTLESFGARLREQVDLDTLQAELRAAVIETMQPAHATLWRRVAS